MAFDRQFYLQQNPDVAESGMDPYEHYINFGREEGRAPTRSDVVDQQQYLRDNPDVAESGMDPQVHYNLFGRDEGRIANAQMAASRNPASLQQVVQNVPMANPEGAGIAPLAYTLATGTTLQLPQYESAAFSPLQEQSFQRAQQEQASYAPMLQEASETTMQGLGAMGGALGGTQGYASQIPAQIEPGQFALGQAAGQLPFLAQQGGDAARLGILGLLGTGEMYSPDMIDPFMNEYEDAAVQQALADIARQGDIAEQGLRAQAVGQGAYGGSRQAVAEQELGRNVLEQQGRTAAQMRQAGYENAAQRAQAAFEQSMSRRQGASQGIGNLGLSGAGLEMRGAQQAGNLGLQSAQLGLQGIQAGLGAQQQAAGIGQGISSIGQQYAGLGQAAQQMGQQDVSMLNQLGAQQQAQQQAILDAQRMNAYQSALMPYQQLAFASDIITGAPTGITSIMSQPGPSPVSQALGLGLTGLSMMGSGGPLAALNPFT